MDDEESELDALKRILIDASAEPVMLSYTFLKEITNNFSQVIGSGGFGVVYMGVFQNWNVAVKKLSKIDDFSEKQFEDELTCLIRVKHKNIVKFLGYCSDTQRKVVTHKGRHVIADIRRRFLCFEYAPNKSLHDYLKDEPRGCGWNTHYQLIEGICQGLGYLHNERINHLDLKPENILLDADMVPKITDFGLSRRFGEEQSRIFTKNIIGSMAYMAPEYWGNGEISFKSDIYSLGIIIKKLLRGCSELPDIENWHRCIEIAQMCADVDQHKRPTMEYIIDKLNEKETTNEMISPVFGELRHDSWFSQAMGSLMEGPDVLGNVLRKTKNLPSMIQTKIHYRGAGYEILPDFQHDHIYTQDLEVSSGSMELPAIDYTRAFEVGSEATPLFDTRAQLTMVDKDDKDTAESILQEGGEDPEEFMLWEGDEDAREYPLQHVFL